MKLSRQSIRAAVLVMMLALAACEGDRPQLEIKLESDYSQIISEIRGVNATLTEKLAAIEKTVSAGFPAVIQSEAKDLSRCFASLNTIFNTARISCKIELL